MATIWIKGDFGPLRPIDFDSKITDLTGLELRVLFKNPAGAEVGPYVASDVGTATWADGRVVRYVITATDVTNDSLLDILSVGTTFWKAWLQIGDSVNELYRSIAFAEIDVKDPGS